MEHGGAGGAGGVRRRRRRAGRGPADGPRGRTVEAVTAGGGIRLTIGDDTVAFADGDDTVLLAVPRAGLATATARVSMAPTDPRALRPEDGKAVLVDLGVGHSVAAFCVRTADPDLVAALRAVEGRTWREALDGVGHRIVADSPHRVVTGPLGRIEVYNPIPQQWGASPEGCHTHLLPGAARDRPGGGGGRRAPASAGDRGELHEPRVGGEVHLGEVAAHVEVAGADQGDRRALREC